MLRYKAFSRGEGAEQSEADEGSPYAASSLTRRESIAICHSESVNNLVRCYNNSINSSGSKIGLKTQFRENGALSMGFLPFDKFSIHTTKSKDDAMQIIRRHTDPVRWFPSFMMPPYSKFFCGRVKEDSFRIVHPQQYLYYPGQPVVIGKLTDEGNFRTVHILIRIGLFEIAFFIFASLFGAGAFFTYSEGSFGSEDLAYIELGLLIYLGVTLLIFRGRAAECKNRLIQFLEQGP